MNKGTEKKFYPHSGFYFYRSEWERSPVKETWKMFKSGYAKITHKHIDDGSFILYSKGYEIFTDFGHYGYNRDPFACYFRSGKAHNILLIDEEDYPISASLTKNVGLQEYKIGKMVDRIQSFNKSFADGTLNVMRDFCSSGDWTVLFDHVKSENKHVYSQLFHLGEQMEIVESDDREVLMKLADTGYFVRIKQLGDKPKLTIHYGDCAKPSYGLLTYGNGSLDTTITLKFDVKAKDLFMATSITIEDANGYVMLANGEKHNEKAFLHKENKMVVGYGLSFAPLKKCNTCVLNEEMSYTECDGDLTFQFNPKEKAKGTKFAFYLFYNDEVIEKTTYGENLFVKWKLKESGNYRVKCYKKCGDTVESVWSPRFTYDAN